MNASLCRVSEFISLGFVRNSDQAVWCSSKNIWPAGQSVHFFWIKVLSCFVNISLLETTSMFDFINGQISRKKHTVIKGISTSSGFSPVANPDVFIQLPSSITHTHRICVRRSVLTPSSRLAFGSSSLREKRSSSWIIEQIKVPGYVFIWYW